MRKDLPMSGNDYDFERLRVLVKRGNSDIVELKWKIDAVSKEVEKVKQIFEKIRRHKWKKLKKVKNKSR